MAAQKRHLAVPLGADEPSHTACGSDEDVFKGGFKGYSCMNNFLQLWGFSNVTSHGGPIFVTICFGTNNTNKGSKNYDKV